MAWMKDVELTAKILAGEAEATLSTWKYDYLKVKYDAPNGYKLGVTDVRCGSTTFRAADVHMDEVTGELTVIFRKERPKKEKKP